MVYIVTSTLVRDYTGVRLGFANVLESYGKVFERDIFQSGYGRVWIFVCENSKTCRIQHRIFYVCSAFFLFLWGFKMRKKMCFMGLKILVIWLWKIYGKA